VGDGDAAAGLDGAEVGRIFREESGRSLAALIRAVGDIDVAEDAVQEAFAVALGTWPCDGVPPNPGGWITTTARNRHGADRRRAGLPQARRPGLTRSEPMTRASGRHTSLKQISERPDAEVTWAAGYPVGPCAIALRNSSASLAAADLRHH
jgi:predicted RNA polymerase sigma factor